jgi:hypothetical protein
MDKVNVKGYPFNKIPRMDGQCDLYEMDGRVFNQRMETVNGKLKRGLFCAYDVANRMTDGGRLKEADKTKCKRQPYGPVCHLVSESVLNLHRLFRATKITLLYLKNENVYKEMERKDVLYVMGKLKDLYGPMDEFDFDVVVKDHDWAIRSLRDKKNVDKPWFKSKSLKEEFELECQRTAGFGDVVRELLEGASDAPAEKPGLDPRFQIIRDLINEKAQEMGHSFVGSTVTMRTREGAVFTVDLIPE